MSLFIIAKHPSSKQPIAVRYGHRGYFNVPDRPSANIVKVSEELTESYLAGSMFGWHVPAAGLARDHHASLNRPGVAELADALRVVALTPAIAEWLAANDPNALAQVTGALAGLEQ